MSRIRPNIIITGTPGVGKTSLCEVLVEATGFQHLSINHVAKERDCHDGWDEATRSWIVDEDKLLDAIENEAEQGGYLIDWHVCDVFPKRWIDLVVVLRSNSAILYDRLKARSYAESKLQENMDAEIMEVLLLEARDAFDSEMVIELWSNTSDDMESNASRIAIWLEQWKQQHANPASPKA
ncbi:MAG: hypothetical protein Q9174_001100 [Haloplaca sp. 1 TL-2023]